MEKKLRVHRRIGLVEAFPPEQVPKLAQYRPLLLDGMFHVVVVAFVDVVELIVVEIVHGRVRGRLEISDAAEGGEHPLLGVQVPHPRRLRP
jgi:hypothetical protein